MGRDDIYIYIFFSEWKKKGKKKRNLGGAKRGAGRLITHTPFVKSRK